MAHFGSVLGAHFFAFKTKKERSRKGSLFRLYHEKVRSQNAPELSQCVDLRRVSASRRSRIGASGGTCREAFLKHFSVFGAFQIFSRFFVIFGCAFYTKKRALFNADTIRVLRFQTSFIAVSEHDENLSRCTKKHV